uniref:DUF3085 domain-containing protein n=1 Tax=Panagrellus redivivus TaxID=6233 RepID=A0A7E4UVI7_PANRE
MLKGVEWRSSSMYRDAAKGEAIIRAPEGQRIVEMALGFAHVMFLTDRNQLMIIGNNKHGQLGSSPDRKAFFRAANQTANNICRPPCNTAHLKFKSIRAIGNESWAWTDDGTTYRCGKGAFWSESTMVVVPRSV